MKFSELSLDTLLQAEPGALYEQALRLRHGDGVATDWHTARRMFGFLALAAHSASRYQLGVMNLRGEAGIKNPVCALMWFRLAHGRDEPRAASQITMLSEELTAIDTRRALRMMAQSEKSVELFMAARQNESTESTESTQAMALLGAQLLSGVGVEQDEAIAVQWLQRAVTRNHPYAQLTLGMAYATGRGVRKNISTAVHLLELSSKQGLPEAHYQLAQLLEQHPKLIRSPNQARHLYESAADHGHVLAQLRLGHLLRGDWIPTTQNVLANEVTTVRHKSVSNRNKDPDLINSLAYFRLAAEQGLADAQFEVGQMYAQGLGTLQIFEEALHWYALSARQGHAKAQFNLAFLYAHGQGVEQNYVKAYEWYRISHLCTYPLAKKAMELTAKKISVGEIEMADWRADSFVYNLPTREDNHLY
jgi:TPR repeat protein